MSIKFEHTEINGWKAAIRGMRNPMNSWDKSDSEFPEGPHNTYEGACRGVYCDVPHIGPKDLDLMKRLRNAGTDHRKLMRYITVYVDITAPLYWWKEFDTYRTSFAPDAFDIEMNSCSTMHKIHEKEFTLDDFSHEHLINFKNLYVNPWSGTTPEEILYEILVVLNQYRTFYVEWDKFLEAGLIPEGVTKKDIWWQMIQLLPSSYNQKRTVKLTYETLANIYKSRKDHKLDEWKVHEPEWEFATPSVSDYGFCDWIRELPYSELITGEE